MIPPQPLTKPLSVLRNFIRSEAASGFILMGTAALALFIANSAFAPHFETVLNYPIGPILTEKLGPMTFKLWINDGLMAIFFLLVGLEIKREMVDGKLSSWEKRRLPFIAAAAGMLAPAAIFLIVAGHDIVLQKGWAIPAATDIAFSLGVLALLGKRVPTSLKLFLLTVAIVDDMGAVAIIALVYTPAINSVWLLVSGAILGAMYLLNITGTKRLSPFLLLFALLWYAILLSGVHATIAGVLAALTIPVIITPAAPDASESPLHRLEHAIHPWSAYAIIPLFGFANAGVDLTHAGFETLAAPLPLGIMLGLFLGKQIGIFSAVWIAAKTGFAKPPAGTSWLQIYGIATICGIGFTMSLFIGELAFPGHASAALLAREQAKIGIISGSILSGLLGYAILRLASRRR
jgi:Na+:H+ antiporter, NhaA family